MVLAAGYGTRLGSLTEHRPKGLLEVGGHALLELIIGHLREHGIVDIAVNLHFMPDLIRDRLGDGSRFAVRLEYAHEEELLGTAGSIARMRDFLDDGEPFLVQYGDVVTDQDIGPMVEAHRSSGALVTLLVHRREASNSVVVMDEDRRITAFLERPRTVERRRLRSPWVNSGLCVCQPELFSYLPREWPADLPADVFPALVESGRFRAHPLDGFRVAVDSRQRLEELAAALADGRYRPPRLL